VGKTILDSWSDNERRGVHVSWLSQFWLKFVLFSNSNIFACYFINHDEHLYVCLRLRQFKNCNMSPTLDMFRCLLVTNVCSPVLDNFKVIDFAFIVWIPGRRNFLSSDGFNERFIDVELMLRFRRRKPNVLLSFVQT
jgi:hypothetical protein